MYSVYILQSEKDHSLYIGQTNNIDDRLLRHNQGRSKYTKSKRSWKLLYAESFPSRSEAVKREIQLKALHRKDLLLKFIRSSG
ncbi:MAG: GIY-YIG nuclease family protein [Nitrospirae bacterium]|nr:GIY-YIG nuclease family protein [Nitrospirota bacterium]